jgi:hypothetical protein
MLYVYSRFRCLRYFIACNMSMTENPQKSITILASDNPSDNIEFT